MSSHTGSNRRRNRSRDSSPMDRGPTRNRQQKQRRGHDRSGHDADPNRDANYRRVEQTRDSSRTIAGFVLRVLLKVSSGHGGDIYVSGRGLPWSYWSAFVTLVAIGIVLLVALVVWIWRRVTSARTRGGP